MLLMSSYYTPVLVLNVLLLVVILLPSCIAQSVTHLTQAPEVVDLMGCYSLLSIEYVHPTIFWVGAAQYAFSYMKKGIFVISYSSDTTLNGSGRRISLMAA